VAAYGLLFRRPAMAAILALVRVDDQPPGGSLLLEPRGYDHVNQASDEHKEAIKSATTSVARSFC